MRLRLPALVDDRWLPVETALCQPDSNCHTRPGANRNPGVYWDDVPDNAASLVLLCLDRDAPSRRDQINREGRLVPASLPRIDFYHWVVIDLAPQCNGIAPGSCSDGIIVGGKTRPAGPPGSRQGRNDYSKWFSNDSDMAGTYRGYDGPCPPWNDTRLHRYLFRLLALDVATLPVGDDFDGREAVAACRGRILATAERTALYTLNRALGPDQNR